MNYYISDLHLGHYNIIKMCNRPFEIVEEMQEKITENWNNVVKNDDHVYILGDLFYRFDGNMETFLKSLHGHKHLIIGNHDGRLLKNKRVCNSFESVDYYKEVDDIIDCRPVQVIMCHYPIVEWNGFFRNSIHLYGHIHNNTTNDTYQIVKHLNHAYNVGADILNFTPCTLSQVRKMNEKFWKEN